MERKTIDSHEVVQCAQSRSQFAALHLVLNACVCFSALLLNLLLLHVVRTQSGALPAVRPILLLGCVYDVLFALGGLLQAPVSGMLLLMMS